MARILIVDDSRLMRMNLTRMLVELGHEVVGEAASGYEAIEQFKRYIPDVITMDITMPAENGIRDGIEAVESIRAISKDVKIIMVTSHGEEDKVMRAIRAGAKNYMLKPVTLQKVTDILKKVLG